MTDRDHFATHQAPDCERCLRGFHEAIGLPIEPVRIPTQSRVILIVRGDRAMVLRAA